MDDQQLLDCCAILHVFEYLVVLHFALVVAGFGNSVSASHGSSYVVRVLLRLPFAYSSHFSWPGQFDRNCRFHIHSDDDKSRSVQSTTILCILLLTWATNHVLVFWRCVQLPC